MTLVIGACVGDAVVLGADSKIQVINSLTRLPVPGAPTTDKKLFKFARVGIATYGDGPPEHVPTVISALHSDCSVSDAINFMRDHFQHAKGMGALIGGLDEHGSPVLFDFPMTQRSPSLIAAEPGRRPPLVLRGIKDEQTDLNAPATTASAKEQMLQLMHEHAGASVGPPYEFLVIERSAISIAS